MAVIITDISASPYDPRSSQAIEPLAAGKEALEADLARVPDAQPVKERMRLMRNAVAMFSFSSHERFNGCQ
jgi:hypothetical protein